MTCLQSRPLKDIYANTFMFDECNILSHGFGGSGKIHSKHFNFVENHKISFNL